jgi:hypothetical protein
MYPTGLRTAVLKENPMEKKGNKPYITTYKAACNPVPEKNNRRAGDCRTWQG